MCVLGWLSRLSWELRSWMCVLSQVACNMTPLALVQLLVDNKSVRPGWVVSNVRGLGGVTCLLSHDITKDGTQDIVVTRDDGEIQVSGIVGGFMLWGRCVHGIDVTMDDAEV